LLFLRYPFHLLKEFPMAFVELNGARFHYEFEGPTGKPVLMLSNSLASALSMWEPQVKPFTQHYRLLRYDQRGHGQSEVTPGPYSTEMLARDALALLDHLKLPKVHFCGLSMGGACGQWLGTNAPERIERLILSNTAAKFGTPDVWNTRIAAVKAGGMAAVADATIERWFTAGFRARSPDVPAGIKKTLLATKPEGFLACCEGLRDNDQQQSITAIKKPTLVIAGTHDMGTPPAAGQFIAKQIAGAKYVELNAAHIANMEVPHEYTKTVLDFLKG
jgi:3-oxoadipate enol-lactonase